MALWLACSCCLTQELIGLCDAGMEKGLKIELHAHFLLNLYCFIHCNIVNKSQVKIDVATMHFSPYVL